MNSKQSKENSVSFGARLKSNQSTPVGKKGLKSTYIVRCLDPDGNEKWRDDFENIVVEEGVNDSLQQHFLGSGYSASWFVGLASAAPTFAYADTLGTHAGWAEVQNYSETQRPELILGTVGGGSVDNSGSTATFSASAAASVGGAFVTNASGKTSTDGILYGGGTFTGGDRNIQNNDTLEVTVTLSAAST